MKMRKSRLCVIDDDPKEIRRFCENETIAERFIVGGGTSLDVARHNLHRQGYSSPDLYVLDLYFPNSGSSTQEQLRELAIARQKVLESQAEFASVLARLGQTPEGGFRLAERISPFGWRTPFVFYSRKATAEDVVRALDRGALRVIKKPDPIENEPTADLDAAYDTALARSAHDVVRDIEDAISRSRFWRKHGEVTVSFLIGLLSSAIVSILVGVACKR